MRIANEVLWGSGPRVRRVRKALGVIVLTSTVVWLVWALATNGWSLNRAFNTCVGQDEEELIDLRRVATDTLKDVDYRLGEYSGCEDVGRAGEAAAIADVATWRRRSAAKQIPEEGWIKRSLRSSAVPTASTQSRSSC